MGLGHIQRHGAANPTQLLAAEAVLRALRGSFDVGTGDQAIAATAGQCTQLHTPLPRQLAYRRGGPSGHMFSCRRGRPDKEIVVLTVAATLQAPDHCAGVSLAFVAEQRFANVQYFSGITVGLGYHTIIGRWNVDEGLGGFHRNQ
ncbi:hypothetical protein D3C76_965980 [compost metagenome]